MTKIKDRKKMKIKGSKDDRTGENAKRLSGAFRDFSQKILVQNVWLKATLEHRTKNRLSLRSEIRMIWC